MDLPKSDMTLVREWAATESLPDGWYISSDQSSSRLRVRWKDPQFQNDYCLLELGIRGGQVFVRHDRRERVKKVISDPKGFVRETKLFQVLEKPSAYTPSWFVRVKKAKPYADMRGIDGFAHCMLGEEKLKLPFQIKSNLGDREKFFAHYPLGKGLIEVIVVKEDESTQSLQCRMFALLGEVRERMKKHGITVADMHQRLELYLRHTKPVS